MIIVSSLVVHIVTQLHQDNVCVISSLDNVPMDVRPYRIPNMPIGTLERDVIFRCFRLSLLILLAILETKLIENNVVYKLKWVTF